MKIGPKGRFFRPLIRIRTPLMNARFFIRGVFLIGFDLMSCGLQQLTEIHDVLPLRDGSVLKIKVADFLC